MVFLLGYCVSIWVRGNVSNYLSLRLMFWFFSVIYLALATLCFKQETKTC